MLSKVLVFTGSRPPKQHTTEQRAALSQRIADHVTQILRRYNKEEWYVVTGGAAGVDTIAFQTAKRLGYTAFTVPAVWNFDNTYSKGAGFERNAFLVTIADAVEAIWDGVSGGTKHTIDLSQKAGKLMTITEYN